MRVEVHGADPTWVNGASKEELLAALAEIGTARRVLEGVETRCRIALGRQDDSGCGQRASTETEIKQRTGESNARSRRERRRAEVADRYQTAADKLHGGQIGGEHLDAVANIVPHDMTDALHADQHQLFGHSVDQTPDEFRDTLREWVKHVERRRGIDRADQQRRHRNGRIRTNPRTGMTEIHAELPPLQGAPAAARIRAEHRRLAAEDQQAGDASTRTTVQRWADAIAHVLLAGGGSATLDDRLPVVIVDADVLADHDPRAPSGDGSSHAERRGRSRIHGGEDISVQTAERFVCDSPVTVVTSQRGVPVAIDTFARRASAAQRRALATIYDSCGRPGCDMPFDDCHMHHIRAWVDTHTTNLQDLIPVCTADHHMLHEGGWQLTRNADWTDTWTSPTGHTLTHQPPSATHRSERGEPQPRGPAP